jgi:hypothetical protein
MPQSTSRHRLRSALLLICATLVYTNLRPASVEALQPCLQRCTLTGSCDWLCTDGGNVFTCGEFEQTCETCGNNYCNPDRGETASNCPDDCEIIASGNEPECGNSVCETGESSTSCWDDCYMDEDVCGDHICDLGENLSNCEEDCIYTDWCNNDTGFCQDHWGPDYYCIGGRCVYEAAASSCDADLFGLDCPGGDMKCINGICVETF